MFCNIFKIKESFDQKALFLSKQLVSFSSHPIQNSPNFLLQEAQPLIFYGVNMLPKKLGYFSNKVPKH
jgi:hypothetical protein